MDSFVHIDQMGFSKEKPFLFPGQFIDAIVIIFYYITSILGGK
jgi:hypothetical protein